MTGLIPSSSILRIALFHWLQFGVEFLSWFCINTEMRRLLDVYVTADGCHINFLKPEHRSDFC